MFRNIKLFIVLGLVMIVGAPQGCLHTTGDDLDSEWSFRHVEEPPAPEVAEFGPVLEGRQAIHTAADVAEEQAIREALTCLEVEPGLFACRSQQGLDEWARNHHQREAAESTLAAPFDPPDPVEIRDGIVVYEQLLKNVLMVTRGTLDLWENTPAFNEAEIAYYRENPGVWDAMVAFRSAEAGKVRELTLKDQIAATRSPQQRRHLVLRDGYFYFEDPQTARWASLHIGLRDLFDEDEIVLQRGARHYVLKRHRNGHYYHTDPEMQGYRARLFPFDRVGVKDSLPETASYNLMHLRRHFGFEYLEVAGESELGRAGRIVFLSGHEYSARLVKAGHGVAHIGVVADPERLVAAVASSRFRAQVLHGLMSTSDLMQRENLFFDEPQNEEGQQDGIMRLAFLKAYRDGEKEYTVNEVVYQVFDDKGRPRPPQVCIDFITDTVERYSGTWWPNESEEATRRTKGRINIRRYMRYRQVKLLVDLAVESPLVARAHSFPEDELVPYERPEEFFDHIWQQRQVFRMADVVVIYGLRSDNRNHYHSFYVYETDAVFGVPTILVDQAGHVRARAWHSIMSSAPKRSIHHRIRWNPYWIEHPRTVDLVSKLAGEINTRLTVATND